MDLVVNQEFQMLLKEMSQLPGVEEVPRVQVRLRHREVGDVRR